MSLWPIFWPTLYSPSSTNPKRLDALADLGFFLDFRGGDFGNRSERSERALRGSS